MSPFFPAAILIIRIVDTIGVILVVDGAKQNVDTNPLLPRLKQSKVVLDRALVLLIFAFPAIPADRCHGAPRAQDSARPGFREKRGDCILLHSAPELVGIPLTDEDVCRREACCRPPTNWLFVPAHPHCPSWLLHVVAKRRTTTEDQPLPSSVVFCLHSSSTHLNF